MKKVSVLVACYCHEKYVENCIRSIMTQDYPNLELIVIDDGSNDRSPEMLTALQKEFSFTLICRENRGVIATLNELLSYATGDYLCDFASDDMFIPGRISKQVAYLDSHPHAAAVVGLPSWIDNNGNRIEGGEKRYFKSNEKISFEDILCGYAEIHGATEMIRTDVMRSYGGWNPEYVYEDLALWLRMLSDNYEIHQINEPLSFYRIHDTNLHSNTNLMYEQTLKMLDKYNDHPSYTKASQLWKMRWFSTLAFNNKPEAFKMLPKLASPTFAFWLRVVKLFIPKSILKRRGNIS